MKPINEIAAGVGLSEDDLELYGKYKAKISLEAIRTGLWNHRKEMEEAAMKTNEEIIQKYR